MRLLSAAPDLLVFPGSVIPSRAFACLLAANWPESNGFARARCQAELATSNRFRLQHVRARYDRARRDAVRPAEARHLLWLRSSCRSLGRLRELGPL